MRYALVSLALLFLHSTGLWARPVSTQQAEKAVRSWLKLTPNPLGTPLGRQVEEVDIFSDDEDNPIYYVIYLQPSGFVIVSADDQVEPIIAFSPEGIYDPSEENPLGALVSRDLPGRVAVARGRQAGVNAHTPRGGLFEHRAKLKKTFAKARGKWSQLWHHADTSANKSVSDAVEGPDIGMFESQANVSDICVAPLVQSRWGQITVCDNYCFNYYSPNHYPCGCVATAMAQLMRYYQHPTGAIGEHGFTIWVDDEWKTAYTRGGDNNGGAYLWSLMDLTPDCDTSSSQRQAIGALCFDAGISVNMSYYSDGSGANMGNINDVLTNTFDYSNAIYGAYNSGISGSRLEKMINPNLDAGYPVILGIKSPTVRGHAILADGYGYNSSTLYHHLNMGWNGAEDAWYDLPDVIHWDTVVSCIYNIYRSGSGEIISGHITDVFGRPVSGAAVTAQSDSSTYYATSNSRGIYVLAKIPSHQPYTISATKAGFTFSDRYVSTGTSTNSSTNTGNLWGINFVDNEQELPETLLYYRFEGALGEDLPAEVTDETGQFTAIHIEGGDPDSSITYADSNPMMPGTSAEFYNDSWINNAGDTFLIPDSEGLDFGILDAFTIELFIYPASSGSGRTRRVFSEYIYAYIYLDGSNTFHAIRKWSVDGEWNEYITELTVPNFPLEEWSHVAMVWDADASGDKFKLYVNGRLEGSASGTSARTVDSGAGFAIGGYQREDASTAQFFQGKIDEFRISTVALEPSELLNAMVQDLDGDNDVDVEDLAAFAGDWLCSGGQCLADMDDDGDVDLLDFAIFAQNWLKGT